MTLSYSVYKKSNIGNWGHSKYINFISPLKLLNQNFIGGNI